MSHIAIKDLGEDTTLDRATMSELHGGTGSEYPLEVLGGSWPSGSNHGNKGMNIPDLAQMMQGVAGQIDDLLGSSPMCSPPIDIR